MAVVQRIVIRNTREPCVHIGAAEILGRDVLAGSSLHQWRSAKEDRALAAHDDGFVGHGRYIGTACRARAHDDGDLRNAIRRHARLVEEDAAEVIAVGKDLRPVRQVRAAGVDEIDAGKMVFPRDLLRTDVFLHCERIVGAALDGGVVAHDHARATGNAADAGDHAGSMDVAAVHVVGGELGELEKGRAGIDQPEHAVAW